MIRYSLTVTVNVEMEDHDEDTPATRRLALEQAEEDLVGAVRYVSIEDLRLED